MPNISQHSFNITAPNVFIRSAVLNPAKNETFTVDIKFMLKVLNSVSIEKFRNRIRMAVCLITDENLLNTMLKYPKYMRNSIRYPLDSDKMMKQYVDFNSMRSQICNTIGNDKEIINSEDGSYVNNYNYNVSFTLTNKTYAYLGCLIVPYYANPQSLSPNGLDNNNLQFTMGDYCVEDLLIGDKSAGTRLAYKLDSSMPNYGSKGQYWVGAVHFGPGNNLMAGSMHHGGQHPTLSTVSMPNKRVIDRRTSLVINNSIMNQLSRDLQGIVAKTTAALQVHKSIQSRDYFSKLSFSRQRDNSLRLFFSVDMIKLALNSVKFPFLYDRMEPLYEALTIKRATLLRTRVGQPELSNKLTGIPAVQPLFNVFNSEEEKVASDLSQGTLQTFAATTDLSKQSFVGYDGEVVSYNAGFYQYKIKLELIDNSRAKFSELITNFKNILRNYNRFVAAATRPGGYNCNSYSFNERRIQELYAREQSPWKKIVNIYLTTLALLQVGDMASSFNTRYWQQILLSLTDPQSATPDTLSQMQELATALLGQLNLMNNTISVSGNSETASFKSTISHADNNIALVKIERTFLSAYEAKNEKNVGLDYMPEISPSRGLPIYGLDSWKKRIKVERTRYGANPTTTANVNGYLSPRIIVLTGGDKIIVRPDMQYDLNAINVLLANFNPAGSANHGGGTSHTDLLSKKRDLLSMRGISIQSFPQGILGYLSPNRSCQSLIDAERVLGKGSRFIRESEKEADKAKLKGANEPEERAMETPLVDRLLRGVATNFEGVQGIDTSQISDSLMATTLGTSRKNDFDFSINANAVQTVQYLAGFKHGHVADPIWAKVTETNIDNLSLGGFLVCRLSPNNSITGKTNNYTQAFSAYNNIFIIGESPSYQKNPTQADSPASVNAVPAAFVPFPAWLDATRYGLLGEEAIVGQKDVADLSIEYGSSRSQQFGDGSYETTFGSMGGEQFTAMGGEQFTTTAGGSMGGGGTSGGGSSGY